MNKQDVSLKRIRPMTAAVSTVMKKVCVGVTPRWTFTFSKKKGKLEWGKDLYEWVLRGEEGLILGYKVSKLIS